jgi:hypothetical protein
VASDHVLPAGRWLYAPGDRSPRHPIVGIIRASEMPAAAPHDGAFLVVSGYEGPVYPLWEGEEAQGMLYAGGGSWLPVHLVQQDAVATRVQVSAPRTIGGWSGHPVVIGSPSRPEAVVGAMWHRSTAEPWVGGTTAPRLLRSWLGRLQLKDYVGR